VVSAHWPVLMRNEEVRIRADWIREENAFSVLSLPDVRGFLNCRQDWVIFTCQCGEEK